MTAHLAGDAAGNSYPPMRMQSWLDTLQPINRNAGDHAANIAHSSLRALVLDGTVPPGAELNQVDIAERLGLSRTPVREAIRMLQEEGLVDAEPWKKARVVSFDPTHLEAVYVQRITLEGLALRLTVPQMSGDDVRALEDMANELASSPDDAGRTDWWNTTHNRFHSALISAASPHLRRSIAAHTQRAERYRTLYEYRGPQASLQHAGEHHHIVELCRERDAEGAAGELAAHFARTALSLIGQLAPRYDPAAIRVGLDLFQSDSSPSLLSTRRPDVAAAPVG
ncbi:MAG: GntR family transcriptional regulator [Candidatus Limnocylindrales bacterium]